MKKVDLTLAVNYVPACLCLCKALVLMLALTMIQTGDEIRGGYIPMAAMLYLDRLIMRNMIFDANAILLALYFANVHAAVRATSARHSYAPLLWGLHLCWIGMCLTLLAEPSKVRWLFEKRVQASKLVPVLLMMLVLTGTSYIHSPMETGPARTGRALGFTLLAFSWIYLVGIHSTQGIEYLKETSCQFTARLAPVLYSPLWLAILFVPCAAGALCWQYSSANHRPEPPPSVVVVTVEQAKQDNSATEDAQLQELFRQAKLGVRPSGLDVIPE
jgi:hypothetical protein